MAVGLVTLTVGSLFSGCGGLDLGLERAGMEIRWNSEIDPYCCRILQKWWPDVPNLGDVTTVDWSTVEKVDLICGGFPCVDISSANTRGRAGLAGSKSGLWRWQLAAAASLRPRFVVVENSPNWRTWVPRVRCDLYALGYSSVPLLLSAGSFGAPHKRPRTFVVADAYGQSEPLRAIHAEVAGLRPLPADDGWVAVAGDVRSDDAPAHRMDRLRAVGNAVVPAVAEWVGRRVMEMAA